MKICTKCGQEKELDNFSKRKTNNDGLQYICKTCAAEGAREWYYNNWKQARETRKLWYENNKKTHREYGRSWVKKNHEQELQRHKKYRETHKEEGSKYTKQWYALNKNKKHATNNAYRNNRRREDPLYNMIERVRNLTKYGFRSHGFARPSKTAVLLGCTTAELKKHIESQFLPGMSWSNRDEWHIDHIIPLASARTKEELSQLCHYTNLRPLWAPDNFAKSDFIIQNDGQMVRARAIR